jgi:hypothetical protein
MLQSVFLSLPYSRLKTTACSIIVAYLGRYSPVFKVLFRVVLRLLMFILFLFSQDVAIVSFVSQMLGDIMITSILVWFL